MLPVNGGGGGGDGSVGGRERRGDAGIVFARPSTLRVCCRILPYRFSDDDCCCLTNNLAVLGVAATPSAWYVVSRATISFSYLFALVVFAAVDDDDVVDDDDSIALR